MDEIKRKQMHKIVMTERDELNISGVIDVISFDEELILHCHFFVMSFQ